MPFSAVTCLSYTGTTTLGGTLNLYSNVDSFTTPFQSSINLSAITGNECPYYISNVPDGTTQIRIFDISTGCYCDIPVQSNNLCVSCDLDFNSYSASTIGRIIAGNLTGTCNPNITDYRIYWYETGDTTNPIYISGFGSEFIPYTFTHPLTGTSAIFAQEGTYLPVIDKIKISGLTFSQTGGTGNIPAELECFTSATFTVKAFTCDNGDGTSDDSNYEHRVSFSGSSAGVTPQTLDSTFLLTATTNYFAWKFRGFAVQDRLRLVYVGSAYSEELILEDLVVGSNPTNSNFSLSSIPKTADTSVASYFVKKVTFLSGLTQNINDRIRLEVIPNSANTQTNWDFYFTCLNSFDQNPCIITNNPYKISASTITSTTGLCNSNSIQFKVSACTRNSDDFSKYFISEYDVGVLNGTSYLNSNIYGSTNSFINVLRSLSINATQFTIAAPKSVNLVCATSTANTITYSKYVSGSTIGIIDMEFSNIVDFNTYYNSFISCLTGTTTYGPTDGCFTSSGPFSGTPSNPTDIRYYRYFRLGIPSNTGTTNCGDGTTTKDFLIHPSTNVTSGTSGLNYTLRFTIPTISNGLTYDPLCNISGSVQTSFVDAINSSSTGTSNNFTGTTLTGSKYTDPFYQIRSACSGVTSVSAVTTSGIVDIPKYLNETIIYTGTTPTIVNSLSAQTFNFSYPRFTEVAQSLNLSYYRRYQFSYISVLNNPSDFRDFQIYANSFTGGTLGTSSLIYSYTGATSASTIHDPSYFI
jgi:hypothetical protein